ncbi:MAG: hypothetical protein LUD22_03950 [Coprobacillus sp.]|nr:hypothetical protein [Coprobacillus sp.]
MEKLTTEQLKETKPGEVLTIAAVMAVLAAAVVAALVCKIVISNSGSVSIPGGWEFSWA